ncbi:hypothetical protein Slit_1264 [Sideroxydans lithotrophicus ES-1]|uniref:Uncharacterized protein n=1 Tax=Sideroxydans lithotrophicus (strain ES-1) TaxID=580332 RepID=D5CRB5_SIDLE|nr:hypothetical protein Slit_1264 [Sideroxydans lithotrophicus ES-1]
MGAARRFSNLKSTPSGVARQLVTFLVLPRKVTQRSRPRFAAHFVGSLESLQTSGAAQLALAGHTKRAPPRSSNSARLNLRLFTAFRGGAQGMELQNPNPKTSEAGNARLAQKTRSVRKAHTKPLCLTVPCTPPSSAERPGVVRRICSSTWPRSGSCEFMRRPGRSSNAGNPQSGRRTGVAFFLVTFSLAKQEKVTSCRATPDGFRWVALRSTPPTLATFTHFLNTPFSHQNLVLTPG